MREKFGRALRVRGMSADKPLPNATVMMMEHSNKKDKP